MSLSLSPNRHIDGSELLQCIMRIPSDAAYRFIKEAPVWFYQEVSTYFHSCGSLVTTVMPFVELDINISKSS